MTLVQIMIQDTTYHLEQTKAALARTRVELREKELAGLTHLIEGGKRIVADYEAQVLMLEKQLEKQLEQLWSQIKK